MKHRLFLDTNIMLDLLGERVPFYEPIAKLATLADQGELDFFVSALSYATVHYFLAKFEGRESSIEKLRKFKVLSSVVAVDEVIIEKGLASSFNDFEDALQYYCALKSNCQAILTRNSKDFKTSALPVLTAKEYLKSISRT